MLLVEDEDSVRELVRLTLSSRGYKVLEAENGEAGLRVAEETKGTIDILVTGMSLCPASAAGRACEKAADEAPHDESALYLSGYTEDATIANPGGAHSGYRFSAKALYAPESCQESARSVALAVERQVGIRFELRARLRETSRPLALPPRSSPLQAGNNPGHGRHEHFRVSGTPGHNRG